jgi:hypothetical protein
LLIIKGDVGRSGMTDGSYALSARAGTHGGSWGTPHTTFFVHKYEEGFLPTNATLVSNRDGNIKALFFGSIPIGSSYTCLTYCNVTFVLCLGQF